MKIDSYCRIKVYDTIESRIIIIIGSCINDDDEEENRHENYSLVNYLALHFESISNNN